MTGPDAEHPAQGRDRVPPPAAPPRRRRISTTRLVAGGLLVLLGVAWLLETLDVDIEIPWSLLLPVVLIATGIALVVGARTGRQSGLVTVGVVLVILLGATSVLNVSLGGGIGERTERPSTSGQLADEFEQSIGSLTLDLSGVEFSDGTTSVRASVGIGQLVVLVPRGTAFEVDAEAGMGEVEVDAGGLDERDGGLAIDTLLASSGYGSAAERVRLELSVGFGSIEVREG